MSLAKVRNLRKGHRKMHFRKLPAYIAVGLSLALAACTPTFPKPEHDSTPSSPDADWEKFLQELNQLESYRYETQATLFFAPDGTRADPPQETLISGAAQDGRILREVKTGITRRSLLIDGVFYEYQIQAAGETWVFRAEPQAAPDLGHPMLLRELFQLGATSSFVGYNENGVLTFRVDVPQSVTEKWQAGQIENIAQESIRSNTPISDAMREGFRTFLAPFANDQTITVELTAEGRLVRTHTTAKIRLGGEAPTDFISYTTTYSDFNAPGIYVFSPHE